jgi:hypothetical protein
MCSNYGKDSQGPEHATHATIEIQLCEFRAGRVPADMGSGCETDCWRAFACAWIPRFALDLISDEEANDHVILKKIASSLSIRYYIAVDIRPPLDCTADSFAVSPY